MKIIVPDFINGVPHEFTSSDGSIPQEAIDKLNQCRLEFVESRSQYITVVRISTTENGDSVWTPITQPYTFSDEFYAVFDPVSGLHFKTFGVNETENKLSEIKNSFASQLKILVIDDIQAEQE